MRGSRLCPVVLFGMILARPASAEPPAADQGAWRGQVAAYNVVGLGLDAEREVALLIGLGAELGLAQAPSGVALSVGPQFLSARALPDGLNLVGLTGALALTAPTSSAARVRVAVGGGALKHWSDEGCFGYDPGGSLESCQVGARDVDAVPAAQGSVSVLVFPTDFGPVTLSLIPSLSLTRTLEEAPVTLVALTVGGHLSD